MRLLRKYFLITGKYIIRAIIALLLIAIGFILFFSWQSDQREAKSNLEAAPSTGRFVQAKDIQVFIQEAGPSNGIPVLLIHGTGAWSEIWRDTMTALAENDLRVIAIDVPPFGFSEKPNGANSYTREKQAERIIGVLDSLDIDKVSLVAHSVGAGPSVETALMAQDRVKNFVLIDPALGFTSEKEPVFKQNNPSLLLRAFFALKPLRNAALATYGTNPLFTKILFQSFVSNKDAITKEKVSIIQKPLVVKDATRAQGDWLEHLLIFKDSSMASDFSNFQNLRMPVLIIWGDTDSVTPLWQGEKLRDLIPYSELKVMPNVGHIPYIEDAENFNGILVEFLNQHR
ncbi:MAG TPA: alpha/beta hydrolase [Candidatus Paceibacterota bacterium]